MTSVDKVYTAFLSKILEDEWLHWAEDEVQEDWLQILKGAIPWFKFPRVSLELDETNMYFLEDLTNEEIQILACYMKCEWLNRNILTWENIKPLYEERDFSQANLLDKFNDLLTMEKKNAANLERIYYRAINNKPFTYRQLAGDNYV